MTTKEILIDILTIRLLSQIKIISNLQVSLSQLHFCLKKGGVTTYPVIGVCCNIFWGK